MARFRKSRWMRRSALIFSFVFAFTFVLGPAVNAAELWGSDAVHLYEITHRPQYQDSVSTNRQTPSSQAPGISHWNLLGQSAPEAPAPGPPPPQVSPVAGPGYNWQTVVSSVNTDTGNKFTKIPLVSWTARGGLPVDFTIYHSSLSSTNMELGPKWSHTYDIVVITDSYGNATIYWGNGQSYTFTLSNGVYTPPAGIYDVLVYNSNGTFTLTKKDQTVYQFTSTPSTNGTGYCTSINDENGNTITIARNTSNLPTSVTDPSGRKLTFSYNASNKLTSITDPLGRTWSFSYNGSGDLSSVTLPALSGTYYSESFAYNTTNDITGLTDPRGNTWQYAYNTNSQYSGISTDACISETDPLNHTTSFAYNSTSLTTTVTDPNNHTTKYNYDSSGRISSMVDAANYTTSYTWDSNNNRTSVTDPRGYITDYGYDSNGNVTIVTTPLNETTSITYNAHNKPTSVADTLGNKTLNSYDSHDNLTQVQQEDSNSNVLATTSYTYDGYGEVLTKTDPNGHTTGYSYDGNGDLASVTTPLSHVTSFGYNGLGIKTSRTDAMGRTTAYTLDNWNRAIQTNYPDGSVYTYSYDPDSNLTGFSDPTGTTTRTYDADNRLTSESKGTSAIKYTYDGTGQIGLLSSVTDQSGRTISYTYTARNELYTVTDSAGTTTYTRDPDGNITGETLPNNATVSNTYDNDDRLSTVTNDGPGGTVLSSFSYAYNSDGQRTGVTENGGSAVSYSYNALHRLTEETRTGTSPYTESFSYDPAGNRTGMTLNGNPINYTYDNDDELLSAGSNTYTYNANGDQITRDLNSVTSSLSYNDDDQLVSITTGSNTTSFAYDAVGRRVARDSGGTTTVFWYDGGNVILESQGGTFTGTYTYGASLIRRNGEYFQYDGLGSTRTITNSSGSQTAAAIYDGYGNTVATSGSTSSPYLFAATSGYRNDNDDGLMLVGARYYDPAVGLFITRDTDLSQPAYQYCNDDPVNAVDPSGHVGWGIIGGIIGGIVGGTIGFVAAGPPGLYYGVIIGGGIGTTIGEHYGDGQGWGTSIGDGAVGIGTGFLLPPVCIGIGGAITSGITEAELEALAAFLTKMFNTRPPYGP